MSSRLAQAFSGALDRVHQGAGGDPRARAPLIELAERVWDAARDGHVCVAAGDDREARSIAASPAVTVDPRARVAPLVLDAGRVYLYRLHRAELRLAEAAKSLDAPLPVAALESIEGALARIDGDAPDPGQRGAVAMALTRRLALITGGPGTGKTTTLARFVVALSQLAPQARVAIAAPTGKAAARLSQSLAAELQAARGRGETRVETLAAGVTVHALLGLRGRPAGDSAEIGAPLPWDVVIVDEASMLDLELASALAQRIAPGSRLLLAGDMDQLASVEAGAVFAELCAARLACVARLDRNYRQAQGAGVAELASALRVGASADAIAAALGSRIRAADDPTQIVVDALAGYGHAFELLDMSGVSGSSERPTGRAGEDQFAAAARELIARYDKFRVLCALREGPYGARALNARIAAAVRRRVGASAQAQWYPGRLVTILRNDREAGLFNGDVGACVDAGSVAFATPDGRVRRVPVLLMPDCEDAWAITVHKSQGSEFESVSFVAAPEGHPLATRELVYTAVTRARERLRVWGTPRAIAAASATRVTREGRLAARIAQG